MGSAPRARPSSSPSSIRRPDVARDVALERRLEDLEMAMFEDFYRALPPEPAESLGIEASRVGRSLRLTARGIDHPFFNRVMGVGLDEPAEDVLAWAMDHYGSAGVRRWMLQVPPHAETDTFRSASTARGVIRLPGWTKHLASASIEVSASSELQVERVDAGAAEWAEIVADGFGFPEPLMPWLEGLARRDGWHLYLALDGDEAVAAAALYAGQPTDSGSRIGELTLAATLPDHRGRGAQSKLVARRIRDAHEMGLDWIATETDEQRPDRPNPSYRNLIRLGLSARHVRGNWGPPKPVA